MSRNARRLVSWQLTYLDGDAGTADRGRSLDHPKPQMKSKPFPKCWTKCLNMYIYTYSYIYIYIYIYICIYIYIHITHGELISAQYWWFRFDWDLWRVWFFLVNDSRCILDSVPCSCAAPRNESQQCRVVAWHLFFTSNSAPKSQNTHLYPYSTLQIMCRLRLFDVAWVRRMLDHLNL